MPTTTRRPWTRDELLLALHLYWRIPFGQQHARNPRVVELAHALGRTSGSVAMKLNNLTSLDGAELARGVRGLPGASALDKTIWSQFQADQETIAAEAEQAWLTHIEHAEPVPSQPSKLPAHTPAATPGTPPAQQETTALRRIRLGQAFFRRAVLDNFGGHCALTGLAHPDLINASHIVPWAEDATHRVDPRNGIALNRLHDAAFDRKLITFDEDLRLVIGRTLRDHIGNEALAISFLSYEGKSLRSCARHDLDPALLTRHREAFAVVNR